MASRKALTSVLARTSQPRPLSTARGQYRIFPTLPRSTHPSIPLHCRFNSIQSPWSSEPRESSTPKKYGFGDIQARLSSTPQPQDSPAARSLVIIDVREPSELASTGRIPGAHNIPISSAPEGLFLPEEEFEEKWGFEKPKEGDEVVFYCKAGVRSRAAAGMVSSAQGGGWEGVRVGEYPGSWVDWEGNGGKIER